MCQIKRGEIEIQCTKDQRESIIDALSKYEYCIFPKSEGMCFMFVEKTSSINCKKCLLKRIKWIIKENKDDDEKGTHES